MIVIKAPAGFDPTWPAIPVDPCDIEPGQRVALAIETPCETCSKEVPGIVERVDALGLVWDACPDCVAGVRLRVEYTAQVDAVVPIVDHDDMTIRPIVLHWGHRCIYYDGELEHELGDVLGDWSPGRMAVLISDVQPRDGAPTHPWLRPFDGPVAELSEVLA